MLGIAFMLECVFIHNRSTQSLVYNDALLKNAMALFFAYDAIYSDQLSSTSNFKTASLEPSLHYD